MLNRMPDNRTMTEKIKSFLSGIVKAWKISKPKSEEVIARRCPKM